MSDFHADCKALKVDECLKSKIYLIAISYSCLNKILIQEHSWDSLSYIYKVPAICQQHSVKN